MGAGGREAQEGGDTCVQMASRVTSAFSRNQYNRVKQLYSNKMFNYSIVKDSSRKCHLS